MNRLLIGIRKEMRMSRSTVMFHIIAILSPLMFLFLWTVTLKQDITLPTALDADSANTAIVSYMKEFSSPGGIRYSVLLEKGISHGGYSEAEIDLLDTIVVGRDLNVDETGISGEIDLVLNNVNANLTKNYRNRLVGAVVAYVGEVYLRGRAIVVEEEPVFATDIPWTHYFSVTLGGLAILFCGLMFGALSFTSEWTSGGMTALALSPVASLWVLGGKLLAGCLKGVVALAIYLGVAAALNPGLSPDFGPLVLTVFLFYMAVFILGMALGLVLREPIISFIAVIILSIVVWALSGGFGTSILMVPWLTGIIRLLPSFYAFQLLEYTSFGGIFPTGAFTVLVITVVLAALVMIVLFRAVLRSGKELVL